MQSTNHDQLVTILTKQGNIWIYFCSTVLWNWLCRSSWIIVTMTHLIPPYIHSSRRKLPCHFVALLFQNTSWSFLRVSGGLCKCCSNLFVFNESFWIRAWSHARFRWAPTVSFLSLIKVQLFESFWGQCCFLAIHQLWIAEPLQVFAWCSWCGHLVLIILFTVCVFIGVPFNKTTDLQMSSF